MIKILLVALAVVIVVVGGLLQHREKGIALAALLVLLTFTGDVLSEVAADMIKPLFFGGESTSEETGDRSVVQGETISRDSSSAHATLEEGKCYTLLVACTTSLLDYTVQFYTPQPIFDITAQSAASGMLTYQYQRDQYTYLPPADGRYCFDTGVSYGGVSMEVKDQAGRRVDGGRNALTVSLRAGELYTLSVFQEYMSLPAEYTVSVTAQQDPA